MKMSFTWKTKDLEVYCGYWYRTCSALLKVWFSLQHAKFVFKIFLNYFTVVLVFLCCSQVLFAVLVGAAFY